MKPIGYTNEKPGDEGTALVPVYKLTDEQKQLQNDAKGYMNLIEELEEQLKDAEEGLSAIRQKCTHHVHRDVGGFPMDQRYCVICEEYRGML